MITERMKQLAGVEMESLTERRAFPAPEPQDAESVEELKAWWKSKGMKEMAWLAQKLKEETGARKVERREDNPNDPVWAIQPSDPKRIPRIHDVVTLEFKNPVKRGPARLILELAVGPNRYTCYAFRVAIYNQGGFPRYHSFTGEEKSAKALLTGLLKDAGFQKHFRQIENFLQLTK